MTGPHCTMAAVVRVSFLPWRLFSHTLDLSCCARSPLEGRELEKAHQEERKGTLGKSLRLLVRSHKPSSNSIQQ